LLAMVCQSTRDCLIDHREQACSYRGLVVWRMIIPGTKKPRIKRGFFIPGLMPVRLRGVLTGSGTAVAETAGCDADYFFEGSGHMALIEEPARE
jgi:hypothetical protein